MWQGNYVKWNPVSFLEGKCLYAEGVHDDWEGFRIWLGSEDRKLGFVAVVKFENVLFYANSDEGFRLALFENEGSIKFPHTFWKVENSQLIKEFHRQSIKIYEDWKITHYAFLTGSDCIDVLSVEEPLFVNMPHDNLVNET